MTRRKQRQFNAALIITVALGCMTSSTRADAPPLRGLDEVNHSKVELRGGFWGPRLKIHHEVTVPHAFLRRVYVNCIYWALGLESAIPEKADVSYVGGDWKASRFGGGTFIKGLMPKDFAIEK